MLSGGEFLVRGISPAGVFVPEDLPVDAALMARSMEGFVRQEVLPLRDRLEARERGLLRSLVQSAGKLGLLAGGLPAPYGLGLAKTTMAHLAEKSAVSLSYAVTIGVHAGVAAYPLLFFGTERQKERYLPGIARGEIVAAFALTEANAGSDALAVQTLAKLTSDGKSYALDGTKLWVTNAGIADLFTVFAQTDGAGISAFLVDRSDSGLAVGKEENKLGLRGSSTCRIMLNQTPIERSQLLGEPGAGVRAALYALNLGRFQIGAIALGGAKEALRLAIS
ncbi:MAG TPA: acyl-CoA dehydrogenase family protein, partial [Capsulimonadaceae bacterium]|nr:acyl-CoA dehydrogenase family protein [Capsulimonadaceae bacterium]